MPTIVTVKVPQDEYLKPCLIRAAQPFHHMSQSLPRGAARFFSPPITFLIITLTTGSYKTNTTKLSCLKLRSIFLLPLTWLAANVWTWSPLYTVSDDFDRKHIHENTFLLYVYFNNVTTASVLFVHCFHHVNRVVKYTARGSKLTR